MTKQVDEIPEWFKIMPKDAKLKVSEVEALFKFRKHNLHNLVHRGAFPKADSSTTRHSKYGNIKILLWSKELILQEIQRREELANATSRA
jgi:hypothetical protein